MDPLLSGPFPIVKFVRAAVDVEVSFPGQDGFFAAGQTGVNKETLGNQLPKRFYVFIRGDFGKSGNGLFLILTINRENQ